MRLPVLLAAALLAVPASSWAASNASPADSKPDDRYIAGYAAAVLEHEFSLRSEGLVVADGHVRYPEANLGSSERGELVKALGAISGVKDVTLYAPPAAPANPLESIASGFTPKPSTQPVSVAASPDAEPIAVAPASDAPLTSFLGIGRTFDPLMADPRWPHFFAEYDKYQKSGTINLNDTVAVGFGETIMLIRQDYPSGFRWEAGVQAGLFGLFDMNSDSADLIDADYNVGGYAAARWDKFSILGRFYHQSSHLGDEYLLRANHVERLNYSFEEARLLLSYDLPAGFRTYGGFGFALDQDPNSQLHPWSIQYGLEWRDPETLPGLSFMRPIAAADFQQRATNDWRFTYSLRAGIELEDPSRFSERLQLMAEYYDGDSTNGQFFKDRNQYFGIGLHFFF
ncbi:MAG: DUF1207 domain-containing protein [Tepidisphaeraceae bacterium]